MKRTFTGIACIVALLLAGCTGESNLPEPSGKGGIRAINAIPGSPFIEFRIEESSIGGVTYKTSTTPVLYDDFEYNFNFDVNEPGAAEQRRIATVNMQVEADREHVFVVTGNIDDPTITTWTSDLRDWTESETVFEARFAHLSETLGEIDVFFQDPADPIAAGGHVARLSYGDIMDLAEFEAGTYMISVTAANDVNVLHYASSPLIFNAQSSQTASLFDGNENDTSPYVIGTMTTTGNSMRIPDPAYPSTIRIIHAAETLPAVDVYRDEALTDLVATNVVQGVPTADIEVPDEEATYYFTPTGSTATTLFSKTVVAPPSSVPTEFFLVGDTDAWNVVVLTLDRSSSSNIAKLSVYHGAFNNQGFEVFVVARGESIAEDDLPALSRVNYSLPSTTGVLDAGSYDVYVTALGTRNAIGGPLALDLALGDVALILATDDVDPAVVELVDVSVP